MVTNQINPINAGIKNHSANFHLDFCDGTFGDGASERTGTAAAFSRAALRSGTTAVADERGEDESLVLVSDMVVSFLLGPIALQ